MKKPGPLSLLICLLSVAIAVAATIIFMPAAELLPAQVFPDKRNSGESVVQTMPGAKSLMGFYARTGVQLLQIFGKLPRTQTVPADSHGVISQWQEKLSADHGSKYGGELETGIVRTLGGEENLAAVLSLLNSDANFIYNAYALFLALALFATAVAVQSMGRWAAEEKTILPVKK